MRVTVLLAVLPCFVSLDGAFATERFTCNLSALSKAERARDRTLMATLSAAVLEKKDLPNGYAFRFDLGQLPAVAEWTGIVAKCCQPLTYEIELGPQPGGALWARFMGAEGVKEFLDGELAEFFKRIPVRPSRTGWLHDENKAFQEARASGKDVRVDFRADWCAACKMMDRRTWADPVVQREIAGHFVPLSLDVTADNEANQAVANKYHVTGLPTVIVVACKDPSKATCAIPSDGPARLTGYTSPAEMVEQLRSLE